MEARYRMKLATADWDHRRRGQITSRERVRDLAEVYTHEREVNAMLDLVPDMFPSLHDPGNTDRTFLEPSCGHGNFLVEILRRKLEHVTPRRYRGGERLEHRALRCLASIYGIDISEDNVRESRERIRHVIHGYVSNHLGAEGPTAGFSDAVEAILETNVIHGDSLTDAAQIELVEYRPGPRGTFIRQWSRLDPTANAPTGFPLPPCRDEVPIHYSKLRDRPNPLARDDFEHEAA
jgi:hypothetical protein